jgi:hypothetical protein
MPKKLYPADVLQQAKIVLDAWNQIDPSLAFGALDPAAMQTELNQGMSLVDQLVSLEVQMMDLRNQRDAVFILLWDLVKRVRSGMKGTYGDDSSQYEMVGGTPVSKRQLRKRRLAIE